MPMEMSSLGPTVGKLVGFLGPVIEESAKNEGFYEQIHRTCLFNGKIHRTSAVPSEFISYLPDIYIQLEIYIYILIVRLHQYIYIYSTHRYGGMAQFFLTPTSGWFHQSFPISGVQLGLPHCKFTTENTNRIGPTLIF